MERHVTEAAITVIHPDTSPSTRCIASTFLERWTRSTASWECYINLLHLFFHGTFVENLCPLRPNDALGAKLMILTLFHSKCRKDFSRDNEGGGQKLQRLLRESIHAALEKLNQNESSENWQLIAHLCASAAVISVRSFPDGVRDFLHLSISCVLGMNGVSPPQSRHSVALKLLACLPDEVEAVDLRVGDRHIMEKEMKESVNGILLCVMRCAENGQMGNDLVLGLTVLRNWACHITLSQLHHSKLGLLPFLIQILSRSQLQTSTDDQLIIMASKSLAKAISQPSDSGSSTREEAVALLLRSITENNFLIGPYSYYTNNRKNDEAVQAIINLATTFLDDEIDVISKFQKIGCSELIDLLLRAQCHPHTPVAISVLESWLNLQDIPTAERHSDLNGPLFSRILDSIVLQISYPPTFTTWDEELELDSQEFEELRRLVKDILISCYFLLRVRFMDQLINTLSNAGNQWYMIESVLFCCSSVSREVCQRVKNIGTTSESIASDQENTTQRLLQLTQQLCVGGPDVAASQHPLVLKSVVDFLGSYAPVWNVCCNLECILQLLGYLRLAMTCALAAEKCANSVKAVLVGCTSKMVSYNDASDGELVVSMIAGIMETVLGTNEESGMIFVAEGSSRLCIQFKTPAVVRHALLVISLPILQRMQHNLDIIAKAEAPTNGQIEILHQSVARLLRVMKEIIRFCDSIASPLNNEPHPLTEVLNALWPIMSNITTLPSCRQHDDVLTQLLALHGQLLGTVPKLMVVHISQLITFVVQAYEETHLPCALDYVGTAVETFGDSLGENKSVSEQSFNHLLGHLYRCTYNYVTTQKPPYEVTQLIRAFFDMSKRYLLFCPSALMNCPEFLHIVALSVALLSECRGERDSTRSSLNFLTQLMNWKATIRSPIIETCIIQNGQLITKSCLFGLAGGMPQMLWPSLSDCMFALISRTLNSQGEISALARQWVTSTMSDVEIVGVDGITPEMKVLVVDTLLRLSREGQKSKGMAKMLLVDFAKICKGDMTSDSLLSYSLT